MNSQVENIAGSVLKSVASVGRGVLSSLYPNDVEYYLLSLELTYFDSSGKEKTLRYFSFPVMPNSITQIEPQITNVKKNYGGLTVINSSTFIPKDITITGNFGRQFRILLGNVAESFSSMDSVESVKDAAEEAKNLFNKAFSKKDEPKLTTKELSQYVKTGYGSLKVMQAICEQSKHIDYKRPRRLYLHNPALGHSYLVKVKSFTANQTLATNMIWGYTLQLQAISPTENLEGASQEKLKDALTNGMLQQGVNSAASMLKKSLTS